MRQLDPIDRGHEDLYLSCVGQTQNDSKRQVLLAMTNRVVQTGVDYEGALQIGRADNVTPMSMTQGEYNELSTLYDLRLVATRGIERRTYNEIRTLSGQCPYCGFGEVYEVDHYLPKNVYPEFNVFPKNLVPICHPCNHIKAQDVPQGWDSSFIHPYYDELPSERWLFAKMTIEDGGPVLNFSVQLDAQHGALGARLEYHFERLELPRRIREQAARILAEMESDIEDYLDQLGADGMKQHYCDAGIRSFQRHGNSIETAAYFAAAENDDYCSGSYRN